MYEITRNSITRMINDTATAVYPGIAIYDWDAHAETTELPKTDLLGQVGLSLTEDGEFHDFTCGIGIVTLDDPGLYRLTKLVDLFYRRLKHQSRFTVYNDDGSPFGVATMFTGTSVTPATQVDVRPAQTLSFSGRLVPEGS